MKNQEEMKEIVSKIGAAESTLRALLGELRLAMNFNDKIEFDGEVLTAERIEKWEDALLDMDKFCYYV